MTRKVSMNIKVTPEERKAYHYAARRRGFSSWAEYIRHLQASDFNRLSSDDVSKARAERSLGGSP